VCPTCERNWYVMGEPTSVEVAIDVPRHSFLVQCGLCLQYFDEYAEGRKLPTPLTREQARQMYPGAVPLSDEPDDTGPRL
jgi:hypothetical protein